MIKVLELFSGTGSVGKCCSSLGWEVVSVDMLLPADHQVDIMEFNYKQYKKDEFDIVWASPPCTEYSKAKSQGKRKIEYPNIGDQLDDLYAKGAFSDDMAAKIKAVKDKYPKG